MTGDKDKSSGGRGVGSGLRGGRTKQASHAGSGFSNGVGSAHVAVRGLSKDVRFGSAPLVVNGLGKRVGLDASGRGNSQKSKAGLNDVNEPTVWRHGSYVKIRPPRGQGPVVTMCTRGGVGSHNRADYGNSMTDLAGLVDTSTTLHDVSEDTPFDDGNAHEDFNDGEGSDDDVGSDGDGGGVRSVGDGVNEDGGDSGDDGGCGVDGGEFDGRELIVRQGKGFGSKINRSAKEILDQCLDGDWITFKQIPVTKKRSMFKRFGTKYRWNPQADQNIYDGFINVLKGRFRDNMNTLRKKSKEKARNAGHEIPDDEENFDITCEFAPDETVPLAKWKRMCNQWNTEKWKNRSKAGRANRKNDLCRHTGGSIGIDEHRIRMEKGTSDKVRFRSIFIMTHATKECKKRLRDGEITETDLDELTFVTTRAKRSYVSYMQQLQKLYGNMDCDDLAVWESLHPECQGRRLFGVGSSDPLFVVTGAPSSTTCGSYSDARQSQQLQNVEGELVKEREARKKTEARVEQLEAQQEKERAEREQERAQQAAWQKKMEEMLKKLADK